MKRRRFILVNKIHDLERINCEKGKEQLVFTRFYFGPSAYFWRFPSHG